MRKSKRILETEVEDRQESEITPKGWQDKEYFSYVIYDPIFSGSVCEEKGNYSSLDEAKAAGEASHPKWSSCFMGLAVRKHVIREWDLSGELLTDSDCDPDPMGTEEFDEYWKTHLWDDTEELWDDYRRSGVYYSYCVAWPASFYSSIFPEHSDGIGTYSTYEYAYNNAKISMSNRSALKCFIRRHRVTEVYCKPY